MKDYAKLAVDPEDAEILSRSVREEWDEEDDHNYGATPYTEDFIARDTATGRRYACRYNRGSTGEEWVVIQSEIRN